MRRFSHETFCRNATAPAKSNQKQSVKIHHYSEVENEREYIHRRQQITDKVEWMHWFCIDKFLLFHFYPCPWANDKTRFTAKQRTSARRPVREYLMRWQTNFRTAHIALYAKRSAKRSREYKIQNESLWCVKRVALDSRSRTWRSQ